jgi:hypothetical protein
MAQWKRLEQQKKYEFLLHDGHAMGPFNSDLQSRRIVPPFNPVDLDDGYRRGWANLAQLCCGKNMDAT